MHTVLTVFIRLNLTLSKKACKHKSRGWLILCKLVGYPTQCRNLSTTQLDAANQSLSIFDCITREFRLKIDLKTAHLYVQWAKATHTRTETRTDLHAYAYTPRCCWIHVQACVCLCVYVWGVSKHMYEHANVHTHTHMYVRRACRCLCRERVYKIHIIYRCHNNNDNYIGTNRRLFYFCYKLSNCNCNQLIHLRFSGTAPPALPPHQSPRPCWILWTEKTPSLSSTFEETKMVVVCKHNATRVASLTNLILYYLVCQIQSITSFDNFFTAWPTILCWCGVDNLK